MRLRNKETGKIFDTIQPVLGGNGCSLAELNEQWEDVPEEPRAFWFIDEEGIIRDTTDEKWPEESVNAAKSIGNYFSTKKEAEQAVEKLKAWQRLRDHGFAFGGMGNVIEYRFRYDALDGDFYSRASIKQRGEDLHSLFGDEHERD